MISITFGLAIFALLAGIALAALHLHRRLSAYQLSKETHDAVKTGVGMIVVLSALVLGLGNVPLSVETCLTHIAQ